MFRVSCIQLKSNDNLKKNLLNTTKYIKIAIKNKSDLIITPELSSFFSSDKKKEAERISGIARQKLGNELNLLDIEDYYLEIASFRKIKTIATAANDLQLFFDKFKEYYPSLFDLGNL